jgi:hypothetical protein
MRAEKNILYNYRRTEENERYSMAVLLFSVLMLGKPPYAARNANYDDVVDAVIAGQFPYSWRSEKTDENKELDNKLLAPVGVWRNIWSHTTRKIKTCFGITFTGNPASRLTAADWVKELREYLRLIEIGYSTDEIAPDGYKDISYLGDSNVVKMVDLVCDECKRPFNLAEDVYQRRLSRGDRMLCGTHRAIMNNIRKDHVQVVCTNCNQPFLINVYEGKKRLDNNKPFLCPGCDAIRAKRNYRFRL